MKTLFNFGRLTTIITFLITISLLQIVTKEAKSSIENKSETKIIFNGRSNFLDPLSGNYTVGVNGNFSSISEAVSALATDGISGSVVFSILPGTYNDNVVIDSVPGMDSNRTITFCSSTGNAEDVVWATDSAAITLTGYSNVTVERIMFENYLYDDLIYFINVFGMHDKILIRDCNFIGASILISQSTFRSCEIFNCEFLTMEPYLFSYEYFIYCQNDSLFWPNKLLITENFFSGSQYCFRIEGLDSFVFIKNYIQVLPTGFRVKSCRSVRFEKNKIRSIGIVGHFEDCNGTENLFINNFIRDEADGISFISCSNWKIVHNTFTSGWNVGNLSFRGSCNNLTLVNNIIQGDLPYAVDVISTNLNFDYNKFHLPEYVPEIVVSGIYNGVSGSWNLTQWRSLSGNDLHSGTGKVFFSDGFHLSSQSYDDDSLRGIPVPYVIDDIDGDPRSSTRPFMGADEPPLIYVPSNCLVNGLSHIPINSMNNIYSQDSLQNGTWELFNYTANASIERQNEDSAFITSGGTSGYFNLSYKSYDSTIGSFRTYCELIVWVEGPMNGTYTIGPGGYFPNIGSAISILNSNGVVGPVVFEILPGTYYESVTIDTIVGVNQANTVTIRSQTDSSGVIWNSTSALDSFALNINGADFLSVEGIDFHYAKPLVGGNAIVVNNNIQNLSILGNQFHSQLQIEPRDILPDRSLIFSRSSVCRNTVITNNMFIGRDVRLSECISAIGNMNGLQIISNHIEAFAKCIIIANTDSIILEHNNVQGKNYAGGTNLELENCLGSLSIRKNLLVTDYPPNPINYKEYSANIIMRGCSFDEANVVSNYMKASDVCFEAFNTSGVKFFHNTTQYNRYRNIQLDTCYDISIHGNIFYSFLDFEYFVLNNSVVNSDHNCFTNWRNIYRFARINGILIPTFEEYKDFTNYDSNSVSKAVIFAQDKIHIGGASISDNDLRCVPLGVETDIDGELRNPIRPFMGVDEPEVLWGVTLKIRLLPEGRYSPILNSLSARDSIKIYIREFNSPFEIVDSSTELIDSTTFEIEAGFPFLVSGRYFIVVRQFNSLETWSKSEGEFFSGMDTITYDFTTSASQAYGENLKLKGGKYCIISGDVFQDGYIDGTDLMIIDNDAYVFSSGRFLASDLNGDGFTDAADMQIADNNNGREVIRP
jgi:hypothetical protein